MEVVVIAHNIRSTHNVGSLFRTCDGLGVVKLYLTGYTPYPGIPKDSRLPHLMVKIEKQIHKTALGAEKTVNYSHCDQLELALQELKSKNYEVVALEQHPNSVKLADFQPTTKKLALLLGNEVKGLPQKILSQVDQIIEIPMQGNKESFNVVVAAAIALYAINQL